MLRRLLAGALVAVCALGVVGCNDSKEDNSSPLYKIILDTVPKGFEVVDGPSGPMDIQQAAEASSADRIKKKSSLKRAGFQYGYSRVWVNKENKDDYIYALVYEFAVASGAADIVNFEIEQLKTKQGYTGFSVPEVPGAQGALISGTKGQTSQPTFCQEVLFSKKTRAYQIYTCSAQPNSGEAVKDLAKDQAAKADAHTE